jgi:geranylgeranyl diphosphate synthase, type I
MAIEDDLRKFKEVFNKELEKFLDFKTRDARKISPLAEEMARTLRGYILRSGKRIRPALMYHTYLALGGKDKKNALAASMAAEFVHTFLIIHDDIIDKDNLRRGKPSVHFFYCKSAERKFNDFSDAVHYGNSQAICVGDMAYGAVNEIVSSVDFGEIVKNRLLKKISDIVFNTTAGEFLDVSAAAEKNVSEKDIMIILEYKTARYTVEGPIHLGAIIAGADKGAMEKLSAYAIPLGIAYQIQDDILGVFGSEKETGKPVGADIKEGKKTLLVVKALEFGNARQKRKINSALGNQKISNSDVEEIRRIIKETGSLEYSQVLAKKLSNKSNVMLEKSGLNEKSKEFFTDVADFIINRNH